MEQVPVQKSKIQMDSVVKTVYDTQMKTRCVPQTTMVTKQIPVYSVVPRPAPPCPPETDCGATTEDDYKMGESAHAFAAADANKDGVISFSEFAAARARENGPTYR